MEMIGKIRSRLVNFYTHLKQEENLQKLYQEKQLAADNLDYEGNDASQQLYQGSEDGYAQAIGQDENMLDSECDIDENPSDFDFQNLRKYEQIQTPQ